MIKTQEITIVILAAGLGTRLRSVNQDLPKVMVPIFQRRPILEHTLIRLKEQGFKNFIVNLHYLPNKITDYFGDGSNLGINIAYSDETDKLLDTAGAIKKIEGQLSDPFILIYGDMVSFLDFRPVLEFHLKNKAIATLVLKRSDHPQNVDLAEIKSNKIVKWHSRPHSIQEFTPDLYVNSGFYILSKRVLSFIPKNTPTKLDSQIIPKLLISNLPVFGFLSPVEILDIGSPERYEIAKKWYQDEIKKNK